MKKLLIVVDMQKDFVGGALGSPEAQAIVDNVVNKIVNWDGDMVVTFDTHAKDYMQTREGKYLPVPHCIEGTDGHKLDDKVLMAIAQFNGNVSFINKPTFGSIALADSLRVDPYDYIELIGLCTDICVVSNAMCIKATLPEADIAIDASCCAGVTPASHNAALATMKMCQMEILNWEG